MIQEPKLTITRSYSKKIQIKQFEPVDFYCSISQEFFVDLNKKEKEETSKYLQDFCKEEVMKSVKEEINSLAAQMESGEGPY